MDQLKRKKVSIIVIYSVLAIFALIVLITGLFPETTVDSAKYAAISRYIFESGDYIHLKLFGVPYLQKPPFLFWLAAISFKIFGISIFAFKLPNLLFSILGAYSVYRLGSLIYNKRTGTIAFLMYTLSEAFFLYSMDVHTDLLLTSCVIFGTWQLAEYLENKKAMNFFLGFTGIGLAMISKGVIGLAVPVFAVAGYLILKKDFRTLFSLRWLAGIPILIVILYPAMKGLYDQFGFSGLKFFFWSNNIDRIRGDYSNGRHDYFFFLHTLLYIFIPWSLFTLSAFFHDFRTLRNNSFKISNIKNGYCYAAIICLGLIISISSQQSPHYLLPIIPFIAIITAKFINDISHSDIWPNTYRMMLIFRSLIIVLLWPLIILMISFFFPSKSLLIWVMVVFMFCLMIFSYIKLNTKLQKLLVPLIITISVLSFLSNTVYMPSALKYYGPIQASYAYNQLASDTESLYTYDYYQFETYFYPKRISEFVNKDQIVSILEKGSCWFITSENGFETIKNSEKGKITEQYIFPYKQLTNLSLKFLNPMTRADELGKIYLIKIE